jgi:hypothetical protein
MNSAKTRGSKSLREELVFPDDSLGRGVPESEISAASLNVVAETLHLLDEISPVRGDI